MKTDARRIRIISICIIIGAFLLAAKLYDVQVVHGKDYITRADRQYVLPNQQVYDRGSIFLATKEGIPFTGAGLETGYVLSIDPKIMKNPEDVYNRLSNVVPLDQTDFMAKADKVNDSYEELADRLSSSTAATITSMKLSGVALSLERWRFYPGKSLAAQTIGFTSYGSDGKTVVGTYGLEKYYQDTLSRDGDNLYANFFVQIFSGLNNALTQQQSLEGDITTSIEPSVQSELETELQSVMDQFHSQLAGGIIMDPNTGAIYAMGVNPTFDLNQSGAQTDPAIYANPLVSGVYEMGSIIKPLTVAAGLDTGVITPDSTYVDTGCATFDTSKVCDFDLKARGVTTVQTALDQSLNLGMAAVEKRLGNSTFGDYFLNKFDLKDKTGVDLPNEPNPLVSNLTTTPNINYITASFGQGIAITPMATIRALSILGNGGHLVTPHLVNRIDYKIGGWKDIGAEAGAQVIAASTSQTISKMLVHVVDTALGNGTYSIPNPKEFTHYSIAAKTGTAQIADNGSYINGKYLHSFFGYFPAYNPKFIIFLYTLEPIGQEYASHTLTAPFFDLASFLISYYNIPPDR